MNAPLPVTDRRLMREVAEDLRTLAWLHAAERDVATWVALRQAGFPVGMSAGVGSCEAAMAMRDALQSLDEALATDTDRANDELAADYADIYLTHALKASPYESVWRDEDHLMLQGPTFAVRTVYRRHGMVVPDWRQMPDDHLAHELSFTAHLLEQGNEAAARAFLDEHLLLWLSQFAQRVAQRARTTVYAALAPLTDAACVQLRERLGPVQPPAPSEAPASTTS